MKELEKIINFITASNWVILAGGSVLGLMLAPVKFTLGIILGGLIVAVNFHLLKKTLTRTFTPDKVAVMGKSVVSSVMVRYYIRFAVSGGLIFLLIFYHIVHPIGLISGLSVVVASIFLATMLELKRVLFKEAV